MTIKIRAGWDNSGIQAHNIAEIAQECGVNAIVLHPRTATQGFRGKADWSLIANIKKKLAIPVIGNGDIEKPHDAIRMKRETDCDALMIGRAAIGNPWIFSQVLALLGGNEITCPDLSQRFDTMIRYTKSLTKYFGEHRACLMMRTQLGWFVKGLRYSSRFRASIKQISTEKDALTLMEKYKIILLKQRFFKENL
jgi:nifR3 family TIM-barrel protein